MDLSTSGLAPFGWAFLPDPWADGADASADSGGKVTGPDAADEAPGVSSELAVFALWLCPVSASPAATAAATSRTLAATVSSSRARWPPCRLRRWTIPHSS
jgi:hypothetical protein